MFDLSVLLLTLNEAQNISALIQQIQTVLNRLSIRFEIVVIDGGSTDETHAIAESADARVVTQKRRGFGGAFREGVDEVAGRYVLYLDADFSHPPELIAELWKHRDDADIVIGSRYVEGGSSEAPESRRFLSSALNAFSRRVISIDVQDLTSGFRIYRRKILTPTRYESENFEILLEVLIWGVCDGYTISELPLDYRPRGGGMSKARVWQFGIGYLWVLARLWRIRNSIVAADYDSRAFDSVIPLQRYWQRTRYSQINRFLSGSDGQILDIGCGSSRIIQHLPNAVALDVLRNKLRFLARTNPRRICASTFALPFCDHAFDKIVHSEVLEHVPLRNEIFEELNRVLKLGGTLVIGTPDYGRIWWPIIEYFYGKILPHAYADEHITHYTKKSLMDILAQNGFRILDYAYICGGELNVKATKVESIGDKPLA